MGKKKKYTKKQIKLFIYIIALILSIISYFYLLSKDTENISNTITPTSNTTYASIEEIKNASVEELKTLPSMNEKSAKEVYRFFH